MVRRLLTGARLSPAAREVLDRATNRRTAEPSASMAEFVDAFLPAYAESMDLAPFMPPDVVPDVPLPLEPAPPNG